MFASGHRRWRHNKRFAGTAKYRDVDATIVPVLWRRHVAAAANNAEMRNESTAFAEGNMPESLWAMRWPKKRFRARLKDVVWVQVK